MEELAIYFPNLQNLEDMDEALRPVNLKKIPSYLVSVLYNIHPNIYDYSVNMSSLETIGKIQDMGYEFSRLYFGQEFCQNLIPPADDVEQAYYISRQLGWNFTYMTGGYLTEAGLEKIHANLAKLKELDPAVEIVVNDWGVLNIIQRDYPVFKGHLVLGRILNKQVRLNLFTRPGQRPPVYNTGIDTPEEQLRENQFYAYRDVNLSNPDYLPVVRDQWGFSNADFDMTPQGINRPQDGWGMRVGFYYPWNFIATGRNCPTAGIFDKKRTFIMTDKPCGRPCRTMNCSPNLIQFEQPTVQRGPALFVSADDFAEAYFTQQAHYERLVYEPYLPL